jgi:thioredoxin 1
MLRWNQACVSHRDWQRIADLDNAILWEVLEASAPHRKEPFLAENVTEVTDETFDPEVLQAEKPVLVDFWAPWCAPCRAVGAVLENLAGERDDLKIVKINIDDNQEQAMKHRVMVLPTIILFKDGEEVGKLQGGVAPTAIARLLNTHVPQEAVEAAAPAESAPASA